MLLLPLRCQLSPTCPCALCPFIQILLAQRHAALTPPSTAFYESFFFSDVKCQIICEICAGLEAGMMVCKHMLGTLISGNPRSNLFPPADCFHSGSLCTNLLYSHHQQ